MVDERVSASPLHGFRKEAKPSKGIVYRGLRPVSGLNLDFLYKSERIGCLITSDKELKSETI